MSRDPDDLVRLSEAEADRLARLYMEAEREILVQIDRAMARGNDLRYLRGMLDNVQTILEDLLTGNRQWCEQAIPRVYVAGAEYADGMVKAKAGAGFGAIHQQAVKVLADNTFGRLESVRQVIGRQSEDLYRQYALEATRQSIIGYKSWKEVAKDYRANLRAGGITGFRDKRGREWNMKTYAEMVARTTTAQAHWEGTGNRLLEHGIDLVIISSHPGACELCRPWQGQVVSLTGKTPGYPTMQEAVDSGFRHPNCRHTFSAYIDLDAQIGELEMDLEETGTDEVLHFPGGPGARVDPDTVRSKYPVERILETVAKSDWASRKAFKEEHKAHSSDWIDRNDVELSLAQFDEIQTALIREPSAGVYYYVHGSGDQQIALYAERLRFLKKVFDRVGLVYNISDGKRVGFWRIRKGRTYFERQSDFVEIRPEKSR